MPKRVPLVRIRDAELSPQYPYERIREFEVLVRLPFGHLAIAISDVIKIYRRQTFHVCSWFEVFAFPLALIIAIIPSLYVYQITKDFPLELEISEIWNPTAAAFTGIIVLYLTWRGTVAHTQRLNRRQHTISVLSQHSFSDILPTQAVIANARYPGPISKVETEALVSAAKEVGLPEVGFDPTSNDPIALKGVFGSLNRLLNYYEFLAVGVRSRDLDAEVLHQFYCTIVCTLCERFREIVKHLQHENPRLLINLIDLYKAWKPSNDFPFDEL